jgi:hypothetical protein
MVTQFVFNQAMGNLYAMIGSILGASPDAYKYSNSQPFSRI